MQQIDGYQNLLERHFPKKYLLSKKFSDSHLSLPEEEKKTLAEKYLQQGEKFLLKGDLEALGFFDAALKLDGSNPHFWHRQGLSFFEYGIQKGKEKALLLASKSFKEAIKIRPDFFEAFFSWGKVLFELAYLHEEHHFFLKAREKYELALQNAKEASSENLFEIHWDLGIIGTRIAEHSGEAVDVRSAIESFRLSLSHQKDPLPAFWVDFGNAYLQMGLLINDNRHYMQAITHFERAIDKEKDFHEGWSSIANAYTQLYINTMDETYFSHANRCYAKAVTYNEFEEEIWLDWASLLGESGKLNQDPKKLRLSVEKCIRANSFAPHHPKIIGQWIESLSLLGALTARHDLLVEAENKIIKAVERYSHDPDLWYAYAICMGALAEYYEDPSFYDFGIEKIQEGLDIDRSSPELWHLLALFHSRIGSSLEDEELMRLAAKFYKRASSLKPACPAILFDESNNLLRWAESLGDKNIAEEAIYRFECAMQVQKNALLHHSEWLFSYASALFLYGELADEESYVHRAVEVFWQVLLIEPDYPGIHAKLGISFAHLADYESDTAMYQKAFHYFRLASKQDPENDFLWLEWGLSLINFAHHTYEMGASDHLYLEAEQKLFKSGRLGNQHAFYHLACLYSLMGKLHESMHLLEKARASDVLPNIHEIVNDEWLEAVRETEPFSHFLSLLESKQKIIDDRRS